MSPFSQYSGTVFLGVWPDSKIATSVNLFQDHFNGLSEFLSPIVMTADS